MARIALTCFRKNPQLAACDPRSVFAAVVTASQMGLEPGINCHLVPYKRECQLVPDWKGLVDLVHRAGRASVWTGAVYEGDSFDYGLGDSPFIKHKPLAAEDSEAQLRFVYAVGRVHGAEWPVVEVWPVGKVLAHRQKFNKVGERHYSFENLEMYARKVALLQVLKYMPKSVELQNAVSLEHNLGEQHLTVEDALDGTAWIEEAPAEEKKSAGMQAVKDMVKGKGQMISDAKKQEAHEQDMIWPKNK